MDIYRSSESHIPEVNTQIIFRIVCGGQVHLKVWEKLKFTVKYYAWSEMLFSNNLM